MSPVCEDRAFLLGCSINPDFIPTAMLLKNFGYGQPEGYPALKPCFLAYIYSTYAALRKFYRTLHLGELRLTGTH